MKKILVRIASHLFPNRVVNFAYNQLANPQVRKLREHELEVLDTAIKETFVFEGFDIQLYTWRGHGADSILLVHGWEGQAGNFADLIKKLIAKDYTVYTFDAPSHGFSSGGRTSLFEFTDLVAVLMRKYGAKKLVSHSFGGVATTFALFENRDLILDKYVLLTTPDRFTERIQDVSEQIGITDKVKDMLIGRLAKETQRDVSMMNVSEFVKHIHVTNSLIIHDVDDRVIPIERAKNVHRNWKGSEFLAVEGTGHFRILRTPSVLDRTLEFLGD